MCDSTLNGIWQHRQQADDVSSADDDCAFSEEDDVETVPQMESGRQFLDRTDIAVFDMLPSVPSTGEQSTLSNVELLSMITVSTDNTDVPRCDDGAGCGSFTHTEHGLYDNDEIDGKVFADMNETLVGDSGDVSDARPQTGSVIESGSGDLTVSPVHSTAGANAASSVQTAPFPNTHTSLARSKLPSRPWRSDATSVSSNEETMYIVEAAELISQAQEHEIAENYPAAYSHYRSGIEILVKGVQSRHFHY